MLRQPAACLLGAVVLAGCGGGGGDDSAQFEVQSTSAGLTTYEVASNGFSVAVPESWRAISVDELADGGELDAAIEETPALKPYVEAIRGPDSAMKFFAMDPKVRSALATNLNIVVEDVPGGTTLEEYDKASSAQLDTLPIVVGDVDRQRVTLPAGEAAEASYRLELVVEGRTRTISTLQYTFVGEGAAYTLTYTTLPALAAEYQPVFTASARSFRLIG